MIRFHNGLTLEPSGVTNNEVWIDGSAISYVGPAKADKPAFERQIDLGGDLLMPGFKNAHTHSGMTFLRSAADDLPLQAAFVKVAFLEYLAGGVTACFDMYYFPDAFVQVAKDWGFRAIMCESLTFGDDPKRVYDRYEKYNNMGPFVGFRLGFHAEYTNGLDTFRTIAEAAHHFKAPVWCHNSETKKETAECVARHGCSPTKLFEDLGLYEYGGGGYHCVYFTPEDMDIFARRGCTAVINACSNGKLASGIFPLKTAVEKGVDLAVGTDGPASNNALDMFREMYLINILAKLREGDAAAGDPALILNAAVSGGARAMGLNDCDAIAVGKQADLVRIDMHRPNMRPVNNVVKNLVYSGDPSNVRMTMIAGKVRYENGEFFVGEDPEDVYRQAEKFTRKILG